MFVNIVMTAGLVIALFASIAAWLNTQLIIKDLAAIKEHLGIKDYKKPSVFDDDLDKD